MSKVNTHASFSTPWGTSALFVSDRHCHLKALGSVVVAVLCALASPSSAVAQVTADVTAPTSVFPGQQFDVTVQVTKGEITGFAKLELSLPEGFTAQSIDASGSTFKFTDGKVKFLWMNLPSASTVNVSYRVSAPEVSSGTHVLNGIFSYVDGSDTRKYRLPDAIFIMTDDLMSSSESIVSKAIDSSRDEEKMRSETVSETNSTGLILKTEAKSKEPVVPIATLKTSPMQEKTATVSDGVVFRVQLLAGRNRVPVKQLAEQFSIDSPILVTEHEGLFKYVMGEFGNYRAAKALSNELRNTTELPGPFVVAFLNGKRISLDDVMPIGR